MTFAQIIRAAIPDADAAICDHILWGRTPYPFTKLTARDIYKAAYRFKRASDHGKQLCDFCDNLALPDAWTCKTCSGYGSFDTKR